MSEFTNGQNNEKYASSLIYSIHDYITKLQCFAKNKRTTLRALNTYKIFHWLYNWADWYGVSEEDKMKLEKLMNCLVLRNSNLVLLQIDPAVFYTNVNIPQTITTWQILTDPGGTIPDPDPDPNTILSIDSSNGGFGVNVTTNIEDINHISSGVTPFTLEYSPTSLVKLTAPPFLLNGNIFNYWSVDGNPQTPNQTVGATSVNVPTTANRVAVVNYRLPQPPIGSITVNKEIFNKDGIQQEDYAEFTVTLLRNGAEYTSGVIKMDTPHVFTNLELGTYQVLESSRVGYSTELPNPKTVVLSTQTTINASITFRNIQDSIIVPSEGNVSVYAVLPDGLNNAAIFEFTLMNDISGVIQTQWGSQALVANFPHVPFGEYNLKAGDNGIFMVQEVTPNDILHYPTTVGYFVIDANHLHIDVYVNYSANV